MSYGKQKFSVLSLRCFSLPAGRENFILLLIPKSLRSIKERPLPFQVANLTEVVLEWQDWLCKTQHGS